MHMTSVILQLGLSCLFAAVASGQEGDKTSDQTHAYSDAQLRCMMDQSCRRSKTCELPCKIIGKAPPQSDEEMTTNFIDDEFEELWDEMQEQLKVLGDHQEELLAQQSDLLGKQKMLEKENERLQDEQAKLKARQEYLESENERLKALAPEDEMDEELREKIRGMETKIKVLTEQQNKLSKQQNRLVELQNKLMARQRKLEMENAKLKKRQNEIEERGFTPSPTSPISTTEGIINRTPEPVDPRVESKLEAIKQEMQNRIDQLTGQQDQLLREQSKLLNRQARLEEENEELRAKQMELHKRQSELEKENKELKLNLTHKTKDPEIRRGKIEAHGLCEVEHGNICFGLLGSGKDELTLELAEENCKLYGGHLANVYDEEHYEKLKAYFINNTISSGVWLGMTYNPQNYRTYLSDGHEARFVNWNWVYPVGFASYTAMYLYIDEDPNSIYSGMVNLPPTWKYPYALCQFGSP